MVWNPSFKINLSQNMNMDELSSYLKLKTEVHGKVNGVEKSFLFKGGNNIEKGCP